ncbi:MAG: hypothetical protein E7053_04540 [Lentisphaerae bacterium]|nr:hypothetical protein [Lentisphaerota bacterium]
MKKLSSIFAMIMLGLTLALTGCRSEEDIKADATPLVEEIFEDFGFDVKCEDIYDIKEIDTDKYTAKAKVSCMGETEEINIKITYDDDTVTVEVEK